MPFDQRVRAPELILQDLLLLLRKRPAASGR
jgi:hypothetical protein